MITWTMVYLATPPPYPMCQPHLRTTTCATTESQTMRRPAWTTTRRAGQTRPSASGWSMTNRATSSVAAGTEGITKSSPRRGVTWVSPTATWRPRESTATTTQPSVCARTVCVTQRSTPVPHLRSPLGLDWLATLRNTGAGNLFLFSLQCKQFLLWMLRLW